MTKEKKQKKSKKTKEKVKTLDPAFIRATEALIFASEIPLSTKKIKHILKNTEFNFEDMKDVLSHIENKYSESGFQLQKISGAYQFRTHQECAEHLKNLVNVKPIRLSRSALEVLSIIAYKQPITRTEIDVVRGVDSSHLLRGLLEKNLIRTAGHGESAGRPLLYTSTDYFLEVFTLNSLDDLPALEEFARDLLQNTDQDPAILAALPGEESLIGAGVSALDADPDRGDFDQNSEEEDQSPDFGLEERAKEELKQELSH